MKKNLNADETLLVKNDIEFIADKKIKGKSKLKAGLYGTIKQNPNKKALGLFRTRLWAYYRVDEPRDSTKFKRFIKRTFAEPPVIYKKNVAEETAVSMKYYLQHKGYKDAVVRDTAITKNKKTKVIYKVEPNDLYTIDTVVFLCKDSIIQQLLNDLSDNTFLERGKPVNNEVFDKELERITISLQNLGYAYFDRSYISPRGLPKGTNVKVFYDVLLPPEQNFHQAYKIGKVFIDPYYPPRDFETSSKDTILVDGVFFVQDTLQNKFKPQNIIKSVFFRPGEFYKVDNYAKTSRQLGNLDIIKSIFINPIKDLNDSTLLNFEILLTPKKRMAIGADVEINNSTYTAAANNLFGLSFNFNYRNRNLFKNAALFVVRVEPGIELNFANDANLLWSRDINIQSDLYVPKFVDPIKEWRLFGKLLPGFYRNLADKAQTRFSAGYTNLSIFDFYAYNSFNMTFGYELQTKPQNRWTINHAGVNLLLVKSLGENFDTLLLTNPFLRNSFSDQLFTGLLLRDISYSRSGKTNSLGVSWFFRVATEFSGLEIGLANWIRNAFSSSNKTFQIANLEFAQYLKASIDLRRYKRFSNATTFAIRAFAGIAAPVGFSDEVPYVKQFFAGGPNSVRAWRIRELGPGSFVDTTIDPNNIPFYQSGDFNLEFSAELRHQLFKFWGTELELGLFADAGNVWTLTNDPSRPGSQLLWKGKSDPDNPGEIIGDNFLKQLAIGIGTGIRLDFSYFIIRFDGALKIRNPFRDADGTYWVKRNWRKLQFNDFNYNLAIGYPF